MIRSLQHLGKLIHECSLPGESRNLDIYPAHGNAIQLSAKRFLIVYCTRGYRGTDDDLSVIYQIRNGSYDGALIREGMLSKSVNDWDAFGNGSKCVRQHGHVGAFGVPHGAVFNGQAAPHANLFVIHWRLNAYYLDPQTGIIRNQREEHDKYQEVEWVQVRLNQAQDDLEIVQPARLMRQVGFEKGPGICQRSELTRMNQSFVQASPVNADASQWVNVNHFNDGALAALRCQFNPKTRLYEWTQTGPALRAADGQSLGEASILRYKDSWLIAARSGKAVYWTRTDDPWGSHIPALQPAPQPLLQAPVCVYACPDRAVRMITGDPQVSPYRNARDPLYLWEVDPDQGYRLGPPRVIFDCIKADVGIPLAQVPRVDMGKLLPHAGGSWQFILHRVRSKATKDPKKTGRAITRDEMDAAGLYLAKVEYDQSYPAPWRFA